MRITTVTVRRLINTGNYENITFELQAELGEQDGLADSAAALCEAIRALARAELARRYPEERGRAFARWLPEDRLEET